MIKNYKIADRLKYTISGALFTLSLAVFISAGAMPTADTGQAHLSKLAFTKDFCTKNLKTSGVAFKVVNDVIVVEEASIRPLSALVERGTLIASLCPGLNVVKFCAGENCLPETGLAVQLSIRK